MSSPGARWRASHQAVSVLALAACLLGSGLPFLSRAFHIDDSAYLAVAAAIADEPWRPFAGAVALDGRDLRVFAEQGRAPNTYEAMSHPPLVPYAIALVTLVVGRVSEPPLHIAFLAFPALALGAVVALGRRYADDPILAGLLLGTAPIFVLCGQGLMTDLPALALCLAAFAVYDAPASRRQGLALALAGGLLGLGALARYTSLGFVLIVAGDALLQRRPRRLGPFAAGFAIVFGAWVGHNLVYEGTIHLLASARHYARYYGEALAAGGMHEKAIADLAGLGGSSLPVVVALLLTESRRRAAALGAASLALAVIGQLPGSPATVPLREYSAGERLALFGCVWSGCFLVASALSLGFRAGERKRERVLLVVWLLGGLAGAILTLPFGASRYVLPVLPPLFLLLANDTREARGRRRALALAAPVSLLLGLGLAAADAAHAHAYRRFAEALPAAPHVYFVGDWGFRFYMEGAGARYLGPNDESPTSGDVVVIPDLAANHAMAPELRRRVRLEGRRTAQLAWPVRTLSRQARAGFWSHAWGYLPFALSRAPLETFEIYRVSDAPAPDGG